MLFVSIPTLHMEDSGYILRKVRVLSLPDNVRIPTVRRTI